MIHAPQIDGRTEEDILRKLRRIQHRHYHPAETGLDSGLAHVFARYCSLVIHRLNLAPLRNQLAFVDMLGVSPVPPQAARVPLTFYLAPQTTDDVLVPAGTQVAAKPGKDDLSPVVFETSEDLPVTALKLDWLFTDDPAADRFADSSVLLQAPAAEAAPILRGNQPVPHLLYVGLHLPLLAPEIAELRLSVAFEQPAASPLWLSWEIWSGVEGVPLSPAADSTASFSADGEVRFSNLPPIPQTQVCNLSAQWVRCRLLAPLEPGSAAVLPVIRSVRAHVTTTRRDLRLEQAVWNGAPLDISKDYYPFGERPRFGDVFYLSNDEAFSSPGAEIRLSVVLTNPAGVTDAPVPPVSSAGTGLLWEYWDGWSWVPMNQDGLQDGTKTLTRSGDIIFRLPQPPAPVQLAGQKKHWIRVRIVGSGYMQPVIPEPPAGSTGPPSPPPHRIRIPGVSTPEAASPLTPPPPSATHVFAPPMIHSVRVAYSSEIQLVPEGIVSYNAFECRAFDVDAGGIVPFVPPEGNQPALYFGFTGPKCAGSHAINLYFAAWNVARTETAPPAGSVPGAASTLLPMVWEYWNGTVWGHLHPRDDTAGLRSSGLVQLLIPADAAERSEFGRTGLWLRLRRQAALDFEPRIALVALNTVMAFHGLTLVNEILGSGNGRPSQAFHTSHAPVLEGQTIEVLERSLAGSPSWIPWQEVGGFHASRLEDRHYVLDHMKGEVVFGDGAHGAIPPEGVANIRMNRYRTGGGIVGNKPAGVITEMRTTVPYVERVSNLEAAGGGADAEDAASLLDRAPRELRHRHRAVTPEDYEDLAMQATTEVARAKCLPLVDLEADPFATRRRRGVVSLILVPRSSQSNAAPSVAMFDRVRQFLDEWRSCSAKLVLAGPEYIRVDLTIEVAVASAARAGTVEQRVAEQLRDYLHPVLGRGGKGAQFGQFPQLAELYAAVEGIDGVEHVQSIDIARGPGPDKDLAHFLVYPGRIAVSGVME
jgi:hypothetical protein